MSVRSFRSVFMVGGVAAAALSCYLVSLRVASERAALEAVETEIVLAQRDIRLLQTEIGTRGRLAQLERWNASTLALSAPSADQFVPDGFQLARLAAPERKLEVEAPVVYASAPAVPAPDVLGESDEQPSAAPALLHEASLKLPAPRPASTASSAVPKPAKPAAEARKSPPAKPATTTSSRKAQSEQASPKPASKAAPKAATVKLASADPLAPLPAAKKTAKAGPGTSKDIGKAQ